MKNDTRTTASGTTASDKMGHLHLVCGSGGSRAILGSAGAIFAFHQAGLREWATAGGISGGSVPTALLAGGHDPGKMVRLAVDIDFASLLTRHANPLSILIAFLLQQRFAQTRPRMGVMSSEKLGKFIDDHVPEWPQNYWTMAVAGKTQIFFTSKGVFQYLVDGTVRQLSNEPAPLGLAVRASCAVPGIIDPVVFKGIHLFDGALSWDGQLPIGAVTRHFDTTAGAIVGCDVGDRKTKQSDLATRFWRWFCGGTCVQRDDQKTPEVWAQEGAMIVLPDVNAFPSLQFTLSAEQKWQAVMNGYSAAVVQLWKRGLLTSNQFIEMVGLTASQKKFREACGE